METMKDTAVWTRHTLVSVLVKCYWGLTLSPTAPTGPCSPLSPREPLNTPIHTKEWMEKVLKSGHDICVSHNIQCGIFLEQNVSLCLFWSTLLDSTLFYPVQLFYLTLCSFIIALHFIKEIKETLIWPKQQVYCKQCWRILRLGP